MKKIHETIADIAYIAGQHGYYSGDSREDMQAFISLAELFEKLNKKVDWDDLKENQPDYMEAVEKFTIEKLGLKNKLILNYPEAFKFKWDSLEIERVREDENGVCEPVHDGTEEANDYFSVYCHNVSGGVMCVADLPTEEDAVAFAKMIKRAVKTFKDNGFMHLYDDKKLITVLERKIEDVMENYTNPNTLVYQKLLSLKSQIKELSI